MSFLVGGVQFFTFTCSVFCVFESDIPHIYIECTGNIGFFGVGAQHSTFFMSNQEHVMSRAITAAGYSSV
jgi:hypothetical protein